MLFPTATFAIFFMLVLPLSWLLQPRGERWRPFIIAASFVFYAAWDWKFCLLLAFSIVWNYALGLGIHRSGDPRHRHVLLVLALVGNLGVLGYFKYYDFFVTSTHNLFALVGLDVPLDTRSIVLPVGISFFTFQGMSYVIDIYRRQTAPATLLDMTLLMSFFPHLVAGPIVRASHLIPQFQRVPEMNRGVAAMPTASRALRSPGFASAPTISRAVPQLRMPLTMSSSTKRVSHQP